MSTLTCLSPLDGRYANQTKELNPLFSEFGLIHHRLLVEIHWLLQLTDHPQIPEAPALSQEAKQYLLHLVDTFSEEDALRVKHWESSLNHDVKALEYFIKEKVQHHTEIQKVLEFVHFGCTSEDINNLAYALMLKKARDEVMLPVMQGLITLLQSLAKRDAAIPMLARTHGQPASPTTLGKEWANFAYRLQRVYGQCLEVPLLGKLNGAVGNYNAFAIAYPEIPWQSVTQTFVESLGLAWNPYTTQIEPHDYLAEWSHAMIRFNTILIDLCRDTWGYISLGYLKLKVVAGEVGSSTMPHKVNPIDFENAEGNLGVANALLEHLASKLPISRWQRDLSDSTVLRNLGTALGYSLLAYRSVSKGVQKVGASEITLQKDLDQHWEVLAEAVQTVMRRYGIPQPYEKLKSLTRGQATSQEDLVRFVHELELPEAIKARLLALTPANYLGSAAEQAAQLDQFLRTLVKE